MCDAFVKMGHEVSLVAGHGGESLADVRSFYGTSSDFSIIRRSRPSVPVIKSALYVCQVVTPELFSTRPDLYYGRDILSLLSLSVRNVPIVYEVHMRPDGFRKKLESRLFKSTACRRLVFISDALKKIYAKEIPCSRECDSVVAHDGANSISENNVASELGFFTSSERLRVGYLGHLYEGRGVDLLLRLAKRLPEFEFHFVGGDECDIDRWKLESSNLQNAVFHGFVEPNRCTSFLSLCDVLAAPFQRCVLVDGGRLDTSSYMSPLKLFEYMASGTAIVTSDLPVLREVLKHGESALLCDPDDDDAWAQSLLKLKDESLRQDLGRTARAKLERHYTWSARAEKVLEGINDLSQKPRRQVNR